MTTSPTYPGVYVHEVPSIVHAIVGVSTSVTGFVGSAARGPTDTPVRCNSWADYERAFGGLDASSPLSWGVYMFFLNGGAVAEVVRAGAKDGSAQPARIKLSDDVTLTATSPGLWGNELSVKVGTDNLRDAQNQFNLIITDGGTGAVEGYTGLSLGSMTLALASSQLMSVDPSSGMTHVPPAGTYTPPAAAGGAAPAAGGGAAAAGGGAAAGGAAAGGAAAGGGTAGSQRGSDVGASQLNIPGDSGSQTGIYALLKAEIFNILCLPVGWDVTYPNDLLSTAAAFCSQQRAMLIVDPPTSWSRVSGPLDFGTVTATATEAVNGQDIANTAIYYPNLVIRDQNGALVPRGPSGAVAGIWAATDATRGVWKAPAGMAAAFNGVADLAAHIDDGGSATLNPLAVNCLRTFPSVGPVVWGARTAGGADDDNVNSAWKYIPVRRTALFLEQSLLRGTQWVVFEPNAEPLWAAIRLNVGAFMNSLFRQGAFQGTTPAQAYLVQCDGDNNPQNSIDIGIVNILVGFAPLKPAEFVFINIEQLAGQIQT